MPYSLVVYDSVLFQRGHTIGRWAESVERRFVRHAKEEAPFRSGELIAGIDGEALHVGVKQWEILIHSYAPHSLYVLKGTTGPIMTTRMWGFRGKYPHLRFPRGALKDPSRPLTSAADIKWLHKNGYALRVRAGNGYPERLALTVKGQRANNFFARAADRTAVTNRSLRGFRPGFNF